MVCDFYESSAIKLRAARIGNQSKPNRRLAENFARSAHNVLSSPALLPLLGNERTGMNETDGFETVNLRP